MSEDGFMKAEFTWRNHHGYEYVVSEWDDGCFELVYREDEKESEATNITITESDVNGVVNILCRIRDFSLERRRKLDSGK